MNYKSRTHWKVGLCLKFDCINRGKKCNECFFINSKYTEYEKRGHGATEHDNDALLSRVIVASSTLAVSAK